MRSSSPTASRFYRAFYQWATLTHDPTTSRAPILRKHLSSLINANAVNHSRKFSLSRQAQHDGAPSSQRAPIREPGVSEDISQKQPPTRPKNIPVRWRDGPVLTPEQRPFVALSHGDDVVRKRTESEIMIEIAILGNVLQAWQETFGRDFEHVKARHGATVELQDIKRRVDSDAFDTPENTLHSVLLSGTFEQVQKAHDTILNSKKNREQRRRGLGQQTFKSSRRQMEISEIGTLFGSGQTRQPQISSNGEEKVSFRTIDYPTKPENSKSPDHSWAVVIGFEGEYAEAVVASVAGPAMASILQLKDDTDCVFVNKNQRRIRAVGPRSSVEAFSVAIRERVRSIATTIDNGLKVTTTFLPRSRPQSQTVSSTVTTTIDPNLQTNLERKETAQLGEDVRIALRALTHPVVLITSREVDPKDSTLQATQIMRSRGVTVSSFNTVTLYPQPIISFNIKVPSRTWDAIESSGSMRIHFLHGNAKGAAIADVFTKPYEQAHEGFHRLADMGVDVLTFKGKVPPLVHQEGAVLAEMHATMVRDHIISVSDHKIVIARVESCKFTDGIGLKSAGESSANFLNDMSALSYAKKGYRTTGRQIVLQESSTNDIASDSKENATSPIAGQANQTEDDGVTAVDNAFELFSEAEDSIPHSVDVANGKTDSTQGSIRPSPQPRGDPIYNVLRGTRDGARGQRAIDIHRLWDEADAGISKGARQGNNNVEIGLDRLLNDRALEKTAPSGDADAVDVIDHRSDSPLWGPEDLAREESGRLGTDRKVRAAFNYGALRSSGSSSAIRTGATKRSHGFGVDGKRPYVTLSTTCGDSILSQRACFSTTRTCTEREVLRPQHTRNARQRHRALQRKVPPVTTWGNIKRKLNPEEAHELETRRMHDTKEAERLQRKGIERMVERNALNINVADFLGLPDDNQRPIQHRVRSLVKLQRLNHGLEQRLVSAAGTLADGERESLRDQIQANERVITRRLAMNAAEHLRLMLDKGRVNAKTALWLEGAIEKGQALSLEDAKKARSLVQDGKISLEQFQQLKLRLERDDAHLRTEANRLREIVEEEEGIDDADD